MWEVACFSLSCPCFGFRLPQATLAGAAGGAAAPAVGEVQLALQRRTSEEDAEVPRPPTAADATIDEGVAPTVSPTPTSEDILAMMSGLPSIAGVSRDVGLLLGRCSAWRGK